MAYKRTTRNRGGFRTTDTRNTNGTTTHSISSGIKGGTRTTTSWSSKGGMKTTQTYKDSAGYVHRKTLHKSETAAQRKRKEREAREFWQAIFGKRKKTTSSSRTATKKTVTPTKQNTSTDGAGIGWLIVLGVIAVVIYAFTH